MLQTQKIAIVYFALKERLIHPEGEFDKQGRWYPSDEENCGVSRTHRSPSRAYPYSYMTACRSRKHVKDVSEQSPELFEKKLQEALRQGADQKLILSKQKKEINKNGGIDGSGNALR